MTLPNCWVLNTYVYTERESNVPAGGNIVDDDAIPDRGDKYKKRLYCRSVWLHTLQCLVRVVLKRKIKCIEMEVTEMIVNGYYNWKE
jgi:hypothetical protein